MNTHLPMRGFLSISTAILLTLGAAMPLGAQEVLVDTAGTATGGFAERGFAISGDGNTAMGRTGDDRIRWTESGGFELFSFGGEFAGLSFDGSVMTGTETAPNGRDRAIRWTQAGGSELLPYLTGDGTGFIDDADAYGISDDGSIIVGSSIGDASTGFGTRAVRWTTGGIESLGTLDPGTNPLTGSVAYAISGDGSTIVGFSGEASRAGSTAFRYTDATGMVSLGRLNNGNNSTALAVSNDGSVVVGSAADGSVFNASRAFRWTNADGLAPLAAANTAYIASRANDVSADGSVVVGILGTGETTGPRAFRWTAATDAMTVENWLRAEGATIAADVTREAMGVSADGSVIVGETQSGEMFIARATGGTVDPDPDPDPDPNPDPDPDPDPDPNPTPNPIPGMITIGDLNQSLAASGTSNSATLTNLGVILNGAGSRPLDRRAAAGRSVFWATGDLGQDQHSVRDGRFGVAELGFGRNFGNVQVNGVIGFSRSHYDTFLGGSTDVDTSYVKLESLHQLQGGGSGGLWLVLGGVVLQGNADITRNYAVGGGAVDSSTGSTSIEGYGLRARLQWEQQYDQLHFAPFGELSHSRACLGAYTETGGAFPASYGQLCDDNTEMRVGFDASVQTSDTFRLTGSLEGVHRFQDQGNNVAGQVVGLGGFSTAQTPYDQNWLRAGAGFETDLAGSTLSVMANATTRGEAADAWLAVTWRMEF